MKKLRVGIMSEFVGGPRDGQTFYSRGEEYFEMPDGDRTMVYRMSGHMVNHNIEFVWNGYREGGVKEVKLYG